MAKIDLENLLLNPFRIPHLVPIGPKDVACLLAVCMSFVTIGCGGGDEAKKDDKTASSTPKDKTKSKQKADDNTKSTDKTK